MGMSVGRKRVYSCDGHHFWQDLLWNLGKDCMLIESARKLDCFDWLKDDFSVRFLFRCLCYTHLTL